ncbi:MAG: S41 family peptidase, partial [Planctomycetota bacterium]
IRNLFVIALSAIVSLTCYSTASRNRYANLFAEALETIESQALQNVPRDELFAYAMDGMTSRLDGHSRYIAGEMFRLFDEDIQQQFGGVGMYVENEPGTGKLIVLTPIPGAPAFDAGIKSGDIILAIDGQDTQAMDRGDAVKLIRGPRGEPVEVLVSRNGEKKSFELVRDMIREPSAHGDFRSGDGSWNFVLKDYPKIGYIRLLQFGSESSTEIKKALEEIGPEVDSLILDLRNNTGGLLDSAIEICDFFLEPDKTIVKIRGRGDQLLEHYYSKDEPVLSTEKPVVILINRDSASASEIVSACLQDHGRAILIGENTWGKGTVQNVIPIEQGKSALKLTTASYWRPSGINIDRYDKEARKTGIWGVQPNDGFEIELDDKTIFDNRRLRYFLDLRGLISPENLEQREDQSVEKIIDEPLNRAIEFLNNQDQKRVAA